MDASTHTHTCTYICVFAVRPLLVEISFNNQPMSADRKYEIECQAIGSRPPAKITWWMGNLEMHGHSQKVSYIK